MAEIRFSTEDAKELKGKVVILTGGAQGIGAATVATLQDIGAHVYFGDWDSHKGREAENRLHHKQTSTGGSAHFVPLDVRNHASQVALFQKAFDDHQQIDVAISCAAVKDPPGLFEPDNLDLTSVHQEPVPMRHAIDINLTSVISFVRIALAFMKASRPIKDEGFSRSIVLVSSIAGITEAPGLFAYSPAKHGVIGLMRALRPWAPVKYGIRANAICPWATDTQLLDGVKERWVEEKLPMNTPEDVARIIVQCAADSSLNGTAVFVSGGRGFDTERGIARTQPQWMGKSNSAEFDRGQKVLGLGDGWTSKL